MITKELVGFINIDKPVDWTSHDVVAKLRKLIKVRQIGHTGTLDPFATGVLPAAIGSATRLIRFLKKSKKYIAELDLSHTTDTDDLTGNILKTNDQSISKTEFEAALKNFIGEIDQVPPLYSAKKIDGKKLYELMREGVNLKLEEIQAKKVKIHQIKLLDFNFPKANIEVSCSEGTYIRSIARDLGAHLTALRRTESNGFLIESSVRFEDFDESDFDVRNFIQKTNEFIDSPSQCFERTEINKLQQGQAIYLDPDNKDLFNLVLANKEKELYLQCLSPSKELIGLASLLLVRGKDIQIQPKIIL